MPSLCLIFTLVSSIVFCRCSLGSAPTTKAVFNYSILTSATLVDVPVWECLEYVCDPTHTSGESRNALNIVFFGTETEAEKKVTLRAKAISVEEAVRRLCHQAGLQFRFEEFAILVGRSIPDTKNLEPNLAESNEPEKKRWKSLRLRRVVMRSATLKEATEFMSRKVKLDYPKTKDLIFTINGTFPAEARVYVSLRHIPCFKLLQYLALSGNCDYRFGSDRVILSPKLPDKITGVPAHEEPRGSTGGER